MDYLCRPRDGKFVATIEDSNRKVVDTAGPFATKDEANAVRMAALLAGAASFADVKPVRAAAKPKVARKRK